jgi:hypothetical protein
MSKNIKKKININKDYSHFFKIMLSKNYFFFIIIYKNIC